MRGGARRLRRDSIDRRPKRARHVDTSPLRFCRRLAWPPAQTACSTELGKQSIALRLGRVSTFMIPRAVGSIEVGFQFSKTTTVRITSGAVERRADTCRHEPGATGGEVERGNLATRRRQQGPQILQPAAVRQQDPLISSYQQPVLALSAERPFVGRR